MLHVEIPLHQIVSPGGLPGAAITSALGNIMTTNEVSLIGSLH
jgi:hypothetical protein